jgi:ABC-type polysaccharide/polyol phosphate export permease
MIKCALFDVLAGFKRADLWVFLGWHDVRQRYRRSSLGPLWITLATLLMVGGMTLLYAGLFRQELHTFLPLVASGVVIWGLIAGCIAEGSNVFISASGTIKQIPAPLTIHVLRLVWTQFIYFLHNFAVVILALLVSHVEVSAATLLFLPAIFLLILNLFWMTLLLGTLSARFRDVPLIVQSFITALFMMTPVLWRVDFLPPERQWVAFLNPFTYLLEVVRIPLLGSAPSLLHWSVAGGMALAGWLITAALYGRSRRKVAYWI